MKLHEMMNRTPMRKAELDQNQIQHMESDLPNSDQGGEFGVAHNDGDVEGMADIIMKYAEYEFRTSISWDHAYDLAENFGN